MEQRVKAGRYRHFKGGTYEVLYEATDAETEAPLVVYRPEGSDRLWVRTRENFCEVVERDGKRFQRFVPIES